MTVSQDEAILQKMLSTMETLRLDQLRLAEQVSYKEGGKLGFIVTFYKFEKLSSATPPKFDDQLSPSTSLTGLIQEDSVTSKPSPVNQSMYPSRVILTSK